ncbi:MAG: hypothetical protein AAGG11_20305 [Pseudomonadota bacterium]
MSLTILDVARATELSDSELAATSAGYWGRSLPKLGTRRHAWRASGPTQTSAFDEALKDLEGQDRLGQFEL